MRLRDGMAHRNTDTGAGTAHHLLGNRQELALGLTLMTIIIISGQEIAHLVHWAPSLAVTLTACLSVPLSFLRAK